jgi:hypothetical protein
MGPGCGGKRVVPIAGLIRDGRHNILYTNLFVRQEQVMPHA